MKVSALGEDGLIRRIARGLRKGPGVVRGIGDDCAVLAGPAGKYALFASDMVVEGVHFKRGERPERVGWKALAVNVSDVAAMGGIPRHAVVSLALPRGTRVSTVDGLYRGLSRCAARFGVSVVGGDTVRSPSLALDVAILGEVEEERLALRSGARPGDALLVTGRLGGAVLSGKHLSFTPRLREARALGSRFKIRAMMDLSDGLWIDLPRLCAASNVGAVLEPQAVPRARGRSLRQALTDGEDFELLIAAAQDEAARMENWGSRNLPCGLTRIGWITRRPAAGKAEILLSGPGPARPLFLRGFEHF